MNIYNTFFDIIYAIIFVVMGAFAGSAAGYILVRKIIHPYFVEPHLKRKREGEKQDNI